MGQAPVVQRLDNAIQRINHYPVERVGWIAIYPVDSVIQPLNNWGQVVESPIKLTLD